MMDIHAKSLEYIAKPTVFLQLDIRATRNNAPETKPPLPISTSPCKRISMAKWQISDLRHTQG